MIEAVFEVTVRVELHSVVRELRVELAAMPTSDEWMSLASDIQRALAALTSSERDRMQ